MLGRRGRVPGTGTLSRFILLDFSHVLTRLLVPSNNLHRLEIADSISFRSLVKVNNVRGEDNNLIPVPFEDQPVTLNGYDPSFDHCSDR